MRLIVLFIAIALAAGAFYITTQFTSNETEKGVPVAKPQIFIKEVPTVDVYTAKQDIPIGAVITQQMLDIQPWPKHLMLEDMVAADPNKPSDILKMVARTPFQKGEPIIMNKLANEKDPSFLAASLPKGMRAVTIAVDAISGAGGFVFPGDRIDVLVTHDVILGKQEEKSFVPGAAPVAPKKDPITEVLLSNIRVMAVNQKPVAHGGEPPIVPTNVTLEVAAGDAQKLRLTESGNGHLSLALRSLKDKDEMELARPTGINDLSRLTPPAYFPVLYDSNGQANFTSPAAATEAKAEQEGGDEKISIMVVRGVKEEAVEVSRP